MPTTGEHVVVCLRQCQGHIIRIEDVARLGHPFREATSRVRDQRRAAVAKVEEVFEHLQLLGLGRVVRSTEGNKPIYFQKRAYCALSEESEKHLIKHRVPLSSFGCDYAFERKRKTAAHTQDNTAHNAQKPLSGSASSKRCSSATGGEAPTAAKEGRGEEGAECKDRACNRRSPYPDQGPGGCWESQGLQGSHLGAP